MPSEMPIGVDAEGSSSLEPVAICGMGMWCPQATPVNQASNMIYATACRLPGGIDSSSSFWDMLVNKRTGQTNAIPPSRFNIDAHYHKNLERPGSFNVPGGYFLDGKPQDFDPSFFNITPVEAQWLDPQQRRMLEVTYEVSWSAVLN